MSPRRQPPAVSPSDVELAIKARIDALSQPGGALYVLAFKAAEKRGRDRVLGWLASAAKAVALLALGWALNHYAEKRSEEAAAREAKHTEFVTRRLQQVEDTTKALAPEAFATKMTNK